MATKETCELHPAHAPKPKSVKVFTDILPELKKYLVLDRHRWEKHSPHTFELIKGISDHDFVNIKPEDAILVRNGETAYGEILFYKVKLQHIHADAYLHVRAWADAAGDSKFHSVFFKENQKDADGQAHAFDVFMTKDEPLEWFNE